MILAFVEAIQVSKMPRGAVPRGALNGIITLIDNGDQCMGDLISLIALKSFYA
jgi:hypothetical protein